MQVIDFVCAATCRSRTHELDSSLGIWFRRFGRVRIPTRPHLLEAPNLREDPPTIPVYGCIQQGQVLKHVFGGRSQPPTYAFHIGTTGDAPISKTNWKKTSSIPLTPQGAKPALSQVLPFLQTRAKRKKDSSVSCPFSFPFVTNLVCKMSWLGPPMVGRRSDGYWLARGNNSLCATSSKL
jgi:hypothetical protein